MKKSSKVSATLCMAALFFLFFLLTSTDAGRPGPASPLLAPHKTQQEVSEMEKVEAEESCEGIGEEECLMRRTLAAHLDYIYTQKHKP